MSIEQTNTITTYTLAQCHECGRQGMSTPEGRMYPHKNLNDWPKDRGTLLAPVCRGMVGTVKATGTQQYDEATGHWHTVEVAS